MPAARGPRGGKACVEKDCGVWINILAHKLRKRMNAGMQSAGLTGVQSRVMHYILVHCADGPVFQRDIESAFELSRSTATGILQLMEKNGLIRRESVVHDARLKSLVPTEKAAQLDAQVGAYLRRVDQRLTEGLTPEEIALFLQIAGRMSDNLDA